MRISGGLIKWHTLVYNDSKDSKCSQVFTQSYLAAYQFIRLASMLTEEIIVADWAGLSERVKLADPLPRNKEGH